MASQPLFFFFLQEQLLWLGVSYIRFRGCQGGLGWVFQGAGMWSLGAQKNRMGFLGPRAGVRIEPSVFGVGACRQHADPKWDTCPKPSARAVLFGGCQLRGARPQVCDVECVTGLNLWGLGGSTSGSYRKKRAPGPWGASAPGGGAGGTETQGAWPARSVGVASASAPKPPCRSPRFPAPQWEAGLWPASRPMSAALGARLGL